MSSKMIVFVDSGAPSLYNKLVKTSGPTNLMGSFLKDRKNDKFDFLDTDDYKAYKEAYIQFLLDNKDNIDYYANLDIINNAEATWQNQLEFEKRGLNPIPVFHLGSDIKWLEMLVKKYDYIAIGGLIPNPPSVLIPILDQIWSKYLTDEKGIPIVKVHGFAVTSVRLVVRYPWFSVDSTTWAKHAIYGFVIVPKLVRGKFIYDSTPHALFVSNKSKYSAIEGRHFDSITGIERKYFMDYFDSLECPMGVSELKKVDPDYEPDESKGERWFDDESCMVEIVKEQGLCNSFAFRNKVNLEFFLGLESSMPDWPWPFKLTARNFGLEI